MSIRYSIMIPLFVALVFLSACKKDITLISPRLIETGKDIRLGDVVVINDSTWVTCGGIRDQEGYIFKTSNSGKLWSTYKVDFPKSVYSLAFYDSLNGWAGGDFLHLWKTTDGGNTWQYHWLADQVPYNEEDRPSIRQIVLDQNGPWYFVGGENLGEGVVYSSADQGDHWDFRFFQNEMRAIESNSNGNLVAGGHGIILTSTGSISDLQASNWENDFITGLHFVNATDLIAVGYNGGIYKSYNNGIKLEKVDLPNGLNEDWNDLAITDNQLAAVANRGVIATSDDAGQTWKFLQLESHDHLFSAVIFNGKLYAGSDHGKIYIIDL